jgi:hypothetical protein
MKSRRRIVDSAEAEHVSCDGYGATGAEPVREVEAVQESTAEPVGDVQPGVSPRPSLATLLMEAGIASEEQIRVALEDGERTAETLGDVVVSRGWASEGRLAQLLADQWGLKALDPGALSLDPLAVARVEIGLASELGGFPVWYDQQGIVVAVSEPNEERFAAFRDLLGNVSFVVVPASTLRELLESRVFGSHNRGESLPIPPTRTSTAATPAASASNRAERARNGNGRSGGRPEDRVQEARASGRQDSSVTPTALQGEATASTVSIPGSLVERFRSIGSEVEALVQATGETRSRVDAWGKELADLRDVLARDLKKIRNLEKRVAERDRRLQALRERVAAQSAAIDDSDTD